MAKPAPPDKFQLYEKLVATNPKIKRKGATVPDTSLNGHMFSYMSKDGKLALRLPPEQRELKNTTPNCVRPTASFNESMSKFLPRCFRPRGS